MLSTKVKTLFGLVLTWCLCFALAAPAWAADDGNFNIDENVECIVNAYLTDQSTGEKIPVEVKKVETVSLPRMIGATEKTTGNTVSAVATISLPNSTVEPFSSETAIKENDVKATITINYDYNSSDNKIRVNKVSGGWIPSNSQIYISEREVNYGDGYPPNTSGGHSDHKYPTINSFSYTTGWPYVDYYPPLADFMPTGARAESSATVGISGMTPHSIQVFVAVSNLLS